MASIKPLVSEGKPTLTLGEIVGRIEGDDGPGPVLFLLTLPVLLPLPPGVSMLMAAPLLMVSPQIMIGRSRLWIPRWFAERQIKRQDLVKALQRVSPTLEKVETAVRPRLRFLTGRLGACVVGAMCTLIALVLVLPIPFANLVPSLAICVFAIGLARRDGGFVLAGYALVILAAVVIAFGAHGAAILAAHMRALI